MQQGWYCPNCYAPNQDFMPACARCGSGKPLAYPMQQMQQQQSINPQPPPPPPPLQQQHHQIGGYRDPRQLGYGQAAPPLAHHPLAQHRPPPPLPGQAPAHMLHRQQFAHPRAGAYSHEQQLFRGGYGGGSLGPPPASYSGFDYSAAQQYDDGLDAEYAQPPMAEVHYGGVPGGYGGHVGAPRHEGVHYRRDGELARHGGSAEDGLFISATEAQWAMLVEAGATSLRRLFLLIATESDYRAQRPVGAPHGAVLKTARSRCASRVAVPICSRGHRAREREGRRWEGEGRSRGAREGRPRE